MTELKEKLMIKKEDYIETCLDRLALINYADDTVKTTLGARAYWSAGNDVVKAAIGGTFAVAKQMYNEAKVNPRKIGEVAKIDGQHYKKDANGKWERVSFSDDAYNTPDNHWKNVYETPEMAAMPAAGMGVIMVIGLKIFLPIFKLIQGIFQLPHRAIRRGILRRRIRKSKTVLEQEIQRAMEWSSDKGEFTPAIKPSAKTIVALKAVIKAIRIHSRTSLDLRFIKRLRDIKEIKALIKRLKSQTY